MAEFYIIGEDALFFYYMQAERQFGMVLRHQARNQEIMKSTGMDNLGTVTLLSHLKKAAEPTTSLQGLSLAAIRDQHQLKGRHTLRVPSQQP